MTQPLPPADVDPDVEREHPGHGEPTHGVEMPADGVERVLDELADSDDPLAAAEAVNYARAHVPNPIVEPEPEGE